MPLKAEIANLDEVDEAHRPLYKQTGDVFRLDVEGVEFPDDVKALRTALHREREDNKGLKRKLAEMPEDFDPEKWRAMSEAQRKAAEDKAKNEGQWDRWKADLEAEHKKTLGKLTEKMSKREQKIRSLLVTKDALTVIGKLGASAKLLMPHIQDMTEVVEEDEDWAVYVLDEKKQRRISTKTGQPMTVEELIAEMRESDDFAGAFPASASGGSGAPPKSGATGGGDGKIKTKADLATHGMKPWEYISKHGSEAYLALPDK